MSLPKLSEVLLLEAAGSKLELETDIDWNEIGSFVQSISEKSILKRGSVMEIHWEAGGGGNPTVFVKAKTPAEIEALKKFVEDNKDTFGTTISAPDDGEHPDGKGSPWPKSSNKPNDVSKVSVPSGGKKKHDLN
jgi:hypothetical protein